MKLSRNNIPTPRNVQTVATLISEAKLLLRRSGVSGAEDILRTLSASIPEIESLNTDSIEGVQ